MKKYIRGYDLVAQAVWSDPNPPMWIAWLSIAVTILPFVAIIITLFLKKI
jgi:hypothetical protein